MKLTLPASPPAAAPSQFFLFANDELEAATLRAEKDGQFTAERLRDLDPKKYQAIIELRGLDWGQKRIAEFLGVHHRTVAAVDDAEPEAIDTVRCRLIKKLRRTGTLLVDRLADHPDLVPIQFAGQTAVQLLGHAELLDGRATARVEHTGHVDIFADWDEIIEKHLQPGEDVIEIGPGTGLAAGKEFAIGAGEERPALSAGVRETDSESEERQPIPSGRATTVTTSVPDRSTEPIAANHDPSPGSRRMDSGAGVADQAAEGANSSTGNGTEKFCTHKDQA